MNASKSHCSIPTAAGLKLKDDLNKSFGI